MLKPEAYKPSIMHHTDRDKYPSVKHPDWFAFITVLSLLSASGFSQEIEPRSLTNVPVGTNFAVLGYGFASGNILIDPALPL